MREAHGAGAGNHRDAGVGVVAHPRVGRTLRRRRRDGVREAGARRRPGSQLPHRDLHRRGHRARPRARRAPRRHRRPRRPAARPPDQPQGPIPRRGHRHHHGLLGVRRPARRSGLRPRRRAAPRGRRALRPHQRAAVAHGRRDDEPRVRDDDQPAESHLDVRRFERGGGRAARDEGQPAGRRNRHRGVDPRPVGVQLPLRPQALLGPPPLRRRAQLPPRHGERRLLAGPHVAGPRRVRDIRPRGAGAGAVEVRSFVPADAVGRGCRAGAGGAEAGVRIPPRRRQPGTCRPARGACGARHGGQAQSGGVRSQAVRFPRALRRGGAACPDHHRRRGQGHCTGRGGRRGSVGAGSGVDPPAVGKEIGAYEFWQLNRQKDALRRRALDAWNAAGIDALILPPAPLPAVPHGKMAYMSYTARFNLLDMTAGIVPHSFVLPSDAHPEGYMPKAGDEERVAATWGNGEAFEGAPVCVQVVCRRFEEEKCLAVMEVVDAAIRGGAG